MGKGRRVFFPLTIILVGGIGPKIFMLSFMRIFMNFYNLKFFEVELPKARWDKILGVF